MMLSKLVASPPSIPASKVSPSSARTSDKPHKSIPSKLASCSAITEGSISPDSKFQPITSKTSGSSVQSTGAKLLSSKRKITKKILRGVNRLDMQTSQKSHLTEFEVLLEALCNIDNIQIYLASRV